MKRRNTANDSLIRVVRRFLLGFFMTTTKFRSLPVITNGARVDRNDKVIYGVSTAQAVEALGHGMILDDTTIQQVVDFGNSAPKGVKSRFTHPGMSSDGLGKVGSFSLSADKTDLFVSAISAWLNSIADVINRHAIPRLLSYNGIDKRLSPKMEFGAVEKVSMSDLADYVSKLTNSELIIPDNELERHLRQQAALPESSEDDRAPNNNEEQAQVDAAQRILARGY